MTSLAGTVLGRYEVLKCLSRGTTTDLWLARTKGTAGFVHHVAIKRIHDDQKDDPAFVQAFLTEARLAGALHHTNIVQVQDVGEDGGAPYFAMEYVHGADLRTILEHLNRKREQLPLEHAIAIACSAAQALHHAHESKAADGTALAIVHRDVTPANILVSYDGGVKVVDFGIAKATITSKTQVGVLKGRTPYMAPEQCEGRVVDRRSDVFALGIVLWELVTMQRLYKGATDQEVMRIIATTRPPRPTTVRSDLPPELDTIIMKALAKLPLQRYQTATALAQALETFASAIGRASTTSTLGTYVKQHLGQRPEPWLVEGEVVPQPAPAPTKTPDVEAEATTVVTPPPPEAEATTVVTPPPPEAVAPVRPALPAPGKRKPSPSPQASATPSVVVSAAPDPTGEPPPASAETALERAETEIDPSTIRATPPPPPAPADQTQLVRTLPLAPRSGWLRRRWLIGAAAVATSALIAIVVVALTSSSAATLAIDPPRVAPPPVVAPPAPVQAPAALPSPPATAASEPKPEPAPPDPPAPAEIAARPPAPPAENLLTHPAKHSTSIAKNTSIAKKPKKPPAKLKYDPNSLFLKVK